jgi:hypothetical protein
MKLGSTIPPRDLEAVTLVTSQVTVRQRLEMFRKVYTKGFGGVLHAGFSAHVARVVCSGVWTRAAMESAMTNTAINKHRLFAKPRFAAFDCSRPSGVMPARFTPSIALPQRTNSARRLPTENFLTSPDRTMPSSPHDNLSSTAN